MTKFLKSVADAFCSEYEDLSEFCFVFPNKRAGTFFKKYMIEVTANVVDRCIVIPDITTISDFVVNLSGREINNRIDLLFTLYEEYNKLNDEQIDFDKFRAWGEVVLSDFSDVDMYGVNPDAIFRNLEEFRKIQTNYLTEEQKQVISEYFGDRQPWNSVESFWLHFNNGHSKENNEGTGEAKPKFLKIWKVLAPLYHSLNARLESKGLCYTGAAYRIAYENLKDQGRSILPYKKIVFVGFNVLSFIELKIFETLYNMRVKENGKEVRYADFYWDCSSPAFKDEQNTATRFILKNRTKFKSQLDISSSDVDSFPALMKSISCPSNAVQAKVASEIVSDIESRIGSQNVTDAKVAIVLPDENLLLPILYSMPKSIKSLNLTMGYPLKMTSVMSFITLLRKMQIRKRLSKGEYIYYFEDIKSLLSHPYTMQLIGHNRIEKIKNLIVEERLYNLPASRLQEIIGAKKNNLFTPLTIEFSPQEVCEYLENILLDVKGCLSLGNSDGLIKTVLDESNICTCYDALRRLKDTINEHGIAMNYSTVFTLADRLLTGETVSFEGEPLQGLQIMGVLETRCLDFDYLIIPSMNERIFPRKMKRRTFIPNTLRKGFGMATTQFQESIFAYYFYRMISRSKEVYMLYDARSTGMSAGDLSRYILQLEYIYPDARLLKEARTFSISSRPSGLIEVKKTPEILEELKCFTPDGRRRRNLSASSLKNYIDCSLKFYLKNIKRVDVDQEPGEFMDAITQGQVFHDVMQDIYTPGDLAEKMLDEAINITPEIIDNNLRDELGLRRKIGKRIHEQYTKSKETNAPMEGDAKIFADVMLKFVKWTLEADRKVAPFRYLGSEISTQTELEVNESLKVNFNFIIDRLDQSASDLNPLLRIVDYKTGTDDTDFSNIEDLFKSNNRKKAIFQLLLYANLYARHYNYQEPIKICIYRTQGLKKRDYEIDVKFQKQVIDDYRQVKTENDSFMKRLNEKIEEIFNVDIPFVQNENDDACTYCEFKKICCQ